MRPLEGRRLWFVGIGGAGMSALRARRARVGRRGGRVGPLELARMWSGSRLRGSQVAIGHDAANVPDGAEVIVSSAIAADNPEVSARA